MIGSVWDGTTSNGDFCDKTWIYKRLANINNKISYHKLNKLRKI